MSGMDLPLAVMITIPEPWANNDTISQEKRDFYQYYATMMKTRRNEAQPHRYTG